MLALLLGPALGRRAALRRPSRGTVSALERLRAGATKSKSRTKLKAAATADAEPSRAPAKKNAIDPSKRGLIATLVLMFQAFFTSLFDPKYGGFSPSSGVAQEGGDAAASNDAPAKAGEGSAGGSRFSGRRSAGGSRTFTVADLESMPGSAGNVRPMATPQALAAALKATSKLVVIDFWASWCGPCKQIKPKFAELSGRGAFKKKAVFLSVDVDANRAAMQEHGVSSMPTFLFMRAGKEVDRFSGADAAKLEEKIEALI